MRAKGDGSINQVAVVEKKADFKRETSTANIIENEFVDDFNAENFKTQYSTQGLYILTGKIGMRHV